jgi:signal peptidase I
MQTPFLQLRRNIVRRTAIAAISLFVLVTISYGFVVQPIRAQGSSMVPNYQTNTYYLLDKLAYAVGNPQRGDVVVFSSPTQPKSSFFKRVVALPGEKVGINGGNIYINGEKLYEPYATGQTQAKVFPTTNQEIMVPGNSYYVLGDNRDSSVDSRDFGFITKENVTGKVSVCYWNCQ